MKYRLFFFMLFVSVVLFSCSAPNHPDEKGHLVVYNEGGDNCAITEVYVKAETGAGYERVFAGSIKDGKNYFIELSPGSYSVMVSVSVSINNIVVLTEEYETGYKIFKRIGTGEFVSVEFDGEGLFFR